MPIPLSNVSAGALGSNDVLLLRMSIDKGDPRWRGLEDVVALVKVLGLFVPRGGGGGAGGSTSRRW